jgi:tetratricopeptide (TPR) repeat protein
LLDLAREMYERGRLYHPKKAISHSIVQVYMWSGQYDLAREQIRLWRAENPGNKYPIYFAAQPAMLGGNWKEAKTLLDEALHLVPDEPMIISLQGVFCALTRKKDAALKCMAQACASPKSFGHAHHTYYQIACILAVLGKPEAAFAWLERSVGTGFACWPFFVKDPCLQNVRGPTRIRTAHRFAAGQVSRRTRSTIAPQLCAPLRARATLRRIPGELTWPPAQR